MATVTGLATVVCQWERYWLEPAASAVPLTKDHIATILKNCNTSSAANQSTNTFDFVRLNAKRLNSDADIPHIGFAVKPAQSPAETQCSQPASSPTDAITIRIRV